VQTGLVPTAIHGFCDYRFRAVRLAFAENFQLGLEMGAAVAVEVEGRRVVDLWAGLADDRIARVWQPDTVVNVYSSSKGVLAVGAARLMDRGLLDVDRPVASYWPEFAWARKGRIPVRWLLSHRAGLPAIREPLPAGTHLDWDVMVQALSRTEPWWEPGTKHGYHVMTFGWLVGEVFRRVAGQSVRAFLRDELSGPLGLDLHLGLSEEDDGRAARVYARPVGEEQPGPLEEQLKDKDSMASKAMANPRDMMAAGLVNSRAWRAAEIPAANVHTNARALARLYGVLANAGSGETAFLSARTLDELDRPQSEGMDAVLGVDTRFGLGFMLPCEGAYFGPNARTLGHPGAGGSIGFADLDARVGFGYVMNQLSGRIGQEDPRRRRLIDAVYAAL
jgi:CubicO group peptidase (beta-lactamase class C family)